MMVLKVREERRIWFLFDEAVYNTKLRHTVNFE
jgi:hypothetical protein